MRKAASIIKMGAVLFACALGSAFISQTAAGGGYGLLGGGINKEVPGFGDLANGDYSGLRSVRIWPQRGGAVWVGRVCMV